MIVDEQRVMREGDRIDIWLLIVVPVVLSWALLLFEPHSAQLGWGGRFAVGAWFTGLWDPFTWVRIRN